MSIAIYLKYPPLARITRLILVGTWAHVARKVSASISSQHLSKARLSASVFLWEITQAFCSNGDHAPKSIGFKSGEDGGQSSFDQNPSKLSYHDTPAHTMTDAGFCLWKNMRFSAGIFPMFWLQTRSFCGLWIAWTVNNFSSVQRTVGCVQSFNSLRSNRALCSLFSRVGIDKSCRFTFL